MKRTKYSITWDDLEISIVYAFTRKEAKIIAKADRIKDGLNYHIHSTKKMINY